MTEDIDAMQNECERDDISHRDLFIVGNILDQKKRYMSPQQIDRQKRIEEHFRARVQRLVTGR